MTSLKNRRVSSVIVFVLLTTHLGVESRAQVDPAWMKSWNEALEQMPETITSSERIASKDEPGISLVIRGLVFTPDGKPAQGVLVNAYHRDQSGLEFGPSNNSLTTWRLNGWARSNTKGQFEFRTIRPAPDRMGREAAHIHFTFVSEKFGRQWVPKIFFSDDSLVTDRQRTRSQAAGPYGFVLTPQRTGDVQYVDAKFRLKKKADF